MKSIAMIEAKQPAVEANPLTVTDPLVRSGTTVKGTGCMTIEMRHAAPSINGLTAIDPAGPV